MAFQDCTCLGEGGNTAWTTCQELFGEATGFAFGRNVATDGTRKSYDITGTATLTALQSDFYNTDHSKRLFPVAGLISTGAPNEGTQYDTGSGGEKSFLRDGIRGFTGEKREASAVWADKINSHRCKDNAVFVATEKGLVGIRKLDTTDNTATFYPIPIRALDANWMQKDLSAGTVEKVLVSFDYDRRMNIGEFWTITWEELGMTEDDFVYEGLLDVNFSVVTAPSTDTITTTVEYALTTDYGTGLGVAQNVNGKLVADFTITNVNSGLAVASATVTEVPGVKYTITYDTETAGNTINVKMATSDTNKFEGSDTYAEPS